MFVSLQVSCAWSLQRAGDGRRAAASDPVVRRAATPDPERPAATPDPERGERGQVRGRRAVKARASARAVGRDAGVGVGACAGAGVGAGQDGREGGGSCGRARWRSEAQARASARAAGRGAGVGAARVGVLVGERVWAWACAWVWYVKEASCGTRCARGTGQARAVMHDGHAGRQLEARLGGLVTRTAGRGNRAVVGGEGAAEVGGVGEVLRDGAEKWTPGAASARGRGACAVWCGGAEK